eukprot:1181550-Prorocentrum_minimum.AAC.1
MPHDRSHGRQPFIENASAAKKPPSRVLCANFCGDHRVGLYATKQLTKVSPDGGLPKRTKKIPLSINQHRGRVSNRVSKRRTNVEKSFSGSHSDDREELERGKWIMPGGETHPFPSNFQKNQLT